MNEYTQPGQALEQLVVETATYDECHAQLRQIHKLWQTDVELCRHPALAQVSPWIDVVTTRILELEDRIRRYDDPRNGLDPE